MVDLDFQASRKRQPPFFRCNLPSIPFEPSFVATTNNIVNEKQNSQQADICQQKGLRVEQLILLRQLVLMSSFAGCIHHKSHDAIAVSEDDGIVRQIGQTSPKLRKTLQKHPQLQFTRQAASTTRSFHQPLVAIPCPTKNKPPKKKTGDE